MCVRLDMLASCRVRRQPFEHGGAQLDTQPKKINTALHWPDPHTGRPVAVKAAPLF